MRTSHYLTPERIIFFNEDISHEEALKTLVRQLDLDDDAVSEAISHRENLGSTCVNSEIAFPHAKIIGLDQIRASLGISTNGIAAPQGGLIRLFLLFVSPMENTNQHLRFLASASSLLLTENMTDLLAELKHGEAVWQKINELETLRYAARKEQHA